MMFNQYLFSNKKVIYSAIILLADFFLVISNAKGQNFINPDLNGNASVMQQLPTGWQAVPSSDPVSRATNQPGTDTPDLTNVTGPWAAIGVMGTPHSGTTYLSGVLANVYMDGSYVFDEGIMQTVTGFTIGQNYTINFYQTVDRYNNGGYDTSGCWRVYKDNSLIGVSAPTVSKNGLFAINHNWEKRSMTFTATATAHTIKFLPEDDNHYNMWVNDSAGAVRMAIDSIWISCSFPLNLGNDTTLCQNNSLLLNATTTNGSYVWQNNSTSPTFNATTSGIYWVTVTANGCTMSDTIQVSFAANLTSSQSQSICSGNSFALPGGSIATISGVYIDTVLSSNGCDSIITTNLTVLSSYANITNPVICVGSSLLLPGGNTVNTAGTYNDTLLSISGCDSIITTNLSVVSAFTINQNITLCSGNTYVLPGGNIISASGIYLDTLVSSSGCDSIITSNITVNPISIINLTPIICSGNNYILTDGTPVNTSGLYNDTLISSKGCDSIINISLTVNPTPVITISPNVTIVYGENTTLTASGGVNYNWFPSVGLNTNSGNSVVAAPTETTTYCVISTNNGCSDTSCVTVFVETPCPNKENFNLPNAFSPNMDGINDEFCLQGWDICLENFSIAIFDRWGLKVFESNDENFCWDGKFKGEIIESQVLIYYVKANYTYIKDVIVKKGNISLIK